MADLLQLKLPNGPTLPLADVMATLAEYDRECPAVLDLYDRTSPGPHDELLPMDVLAVNALNAFGSHTPPMTPMTELWKRRTDVVEEAKIVSITKAAVENLSESALRDQLDAVSNALWVIDNVRGFGSTASTKLLHRLRPNIVPIWDSRVESWYPTPENDNSWSTWLRRVYADIRNQENQACLSAARAGFDARLHIVRIWDILLWQRGSSGKEGAES